MPDLLYHVVKTDEGELEIIAATKTEVDDGWVPGEILHSCPDEESAKEKLEEEAAKLAKKAKKANRVKRVKRVKKVKKVK